MMLETLSRETLFVPPGGVSGVTVLPEVQHRVAVQRPRTPRPALGRSRVETDPLHREPYAAWPALAVRPASSSHPTQPGLRRASPTSRPGGVLRITRRGRLVLLASVVALLFVAFSVGRVISNAESSAPAKPATHTVVVAPGDTAWSIARAAMPRLDGRDAVDRLLALNHSDGRLQVGQTLLVPGG